MDRLAFPPESRASPVLSERQGFFGWRGGAEAAKPVTVKPSKHVATGINGFENRTGSVLRRGAALPLGKSSRPRRGGRGDAGGAVGAAQAAVPAQPCEHLSARRRRRLDHGGFRFRQ